MSSVLNKSCPGIKKVQIVFKFILTILVINIAIPTNHLAYGMIQSKNISGLVIKSIARETTTNTYDETGKLTSVKKPENNMKQMTYDTASRLVSADDGVVTTNYEYDNNDK
ncbi:MAG: RHS repeat protein [Desulfobacterales bacterium]|nr:RHS repeat protein [Desulfobacterales bacterium]